MSLSESTIEQREKEEKALKSFFTYSLIGSLTLHMGLLAFGINNFLIRVPQVEDEPIEVTIIDPPTPEKTEPSQEPEETKPPAGAGSSEVSRVLMSSRGGSTDGLVVCIEGVQ